MNKEKRKILKKYFLISKKKREEIKEIIEKSLEKLELLEIRKTRENKNECDGFCKRLKEKFLSILKVVIENEQYQQLAKQGENSFSAVELSDFYKSLVDEIKVEEQKENGIEKIINREIKIEEKSDIMITGKQKHYLEEKDGGIGEEGEGMSGSPFPLEVKRLGIYISYREKQQLMYIGEIVEYKGKFNYQLDYLNTVIDSSRLGYTYIIKSLYKFKKPVTLQELQKYKCERTNKFFHRPPQSFVYLSSFPGLVSDIVSGKFQ